MSNYIMDLRKIVGHRTLIMPGAGIIIINEKNQILLGKRADNHLWGYPGGSIEIDEKVEDAAKRELFEETGLIADEIELYHISSGPDSHYVYPNGDEISNIDIVFICRKYHGQLKPQPEEIEELRFFDINKITLDMISPPIRETFEKLLKTICD